MRGCAAVIDGSGSTECPMATRRRSLRWICSCRCVNCSYDECVGLDQTIAVQGFVTDQPLLSNNRSPTKGSVPHFYTKRATLSLSIWDGGTGSLGFGGWVRGWVGAPRGHACARREARGRMRLSRCARGERWIASSACCGLVPLPHGAGDELGTGYYGCLWVVEWGQARWFCRLGARLGLRGAMPARAGKLGGRTRLSRCARLERWIASSACSGLVPLLLGCRR